MAVAAMLAVACSQGPSIAPAALDDDMLDSDEMPEGPPGVTVGSDGVETGGGTSGDASRPAARTTDEGPSTSGAAAGDASEARSDQEGPGGEPSSHDEERASSTSGRIPGGGPGVTDDEIALGFQVTEDVQAAFAVVGAGGDAPDDRRIVEALVAWVNANGGMGGRQVRPVFHATSVTNGTFASQAQAACSTFTEDETVFAVSSGPVTVGDTLLACLAEKGTPLVEGNYWHFDQSYYDRFAGLLYRPGRMRPERWARAYVDGLLAEGFFGDASAPNRVGLLRFDAPVFDRIAHGILKPRMAELGLDPPVEIEITTPQSVAAFGGMSAELQNAIVRLRSEGVTHLLFLENGAVMTFFFSQEAENQGYRPVYGLSSADTPATLANQAPPEQLRSSIGIGWQPPIELFYPEHPGGNPAWETCRQIMDDAGITTTYLSRGYYTQSRCDGVFFLKAALDRADELSAAGLRRSSNSLGSIYRSPFSFETRLDPGRFDGAQGAAPFRFVDECGCFRYSGPPRST